MPGYIVNAEGVKINKKPWHFVKRKTYKRTSKLPPLPIPLGSLSKLEDAIFEDSSEKRIKFLNLYKSLKEDEDIEKYLAKHQNRWLYALCHCWFKLKWRPSASGKKVLINPYLNKLKK